MCTVLPLALFGAAGAAPGTPEAEGFQFLGALRDPALPELSGLAASMRRADLTWALSDSGNPAELVALDGALKRAGVVRVDGVINHDWEDLAAFEDAQGRWLVIADTGDNLGLRSEVSLVVVPEPEPAAVSVAPARVIRFRYEDGSRDCESVAVDVPGRRVLLVDKGRRPAGLYALPLAGDDAVVRVSRRIGTFPDLVPTPAPPVLPIGAAKWRGMATSMDLSPDGLGMIVLSTLSATLFRRAPDQAWDAALAQPVLSQRLPRVPSFESITFARGARSALIGTEIVPTRFYSWTLPPAPGARPRLHAGAPDPAEQRIRRP